MIEIVRDIFGAREGVRSGSNRPMVCAVSGRIIPAASVHIGWRSLREVFVRAIISCRARHIIIH